MPGDEIRLMFGMDSLEGVKLGNSCRVIYVLSYLRGQFKECEAKAEDAGGSVEWELV